MPKIDRALNSAIGSLTLVVTLLAVPMHVQAEKPAAIGATSSEHDGPTARPAKFEFSGSVKQLFKELKPLLAANGLALVTIDPAVVQYAAVDLQKQMDYRCDERPMERILEDLLSPLQLRADVSDEGAVRILPDLVRLTRQGIGTDQWVNRDEVLMKKVQEVLATKVSLKVEDQPLSELVESLHRQSGAAMTIDEISLEDIGLSQSSPITIHAENVSLRDALHAALQPLDLTFLTHEGLIQITSLEDAEHYLGTRIYWLEGIVNRTDEIRLVIASIETSIEPDTWESLGGNSTIHPMTQGGRPAILISAPDQIHTQIEQLIRVLRANIVGPMPYQNEPDALKGHPNFIGGGMGGGAMGGGGGMGGGGCF